MMAFRPGRRHKQTGTIVLLVLLLLTTSAAVPFLHSLNATRAKQARAERTAQALARAKEALLSFAMAYPDRDNNKDAETGPGYLPCPDLNDDGEISVSESDAQCKETNLGRLPWAFLRVDDIRDGSGERLWYAIAAEYRSIGAKHRPLNSETRGRLSVADQDDIVAVLIAPGPPLPGQQRDKVSVNLAANYLEGENADVPANGRFAGRASASEPFNDVLLTITHKDIARAMEQRALAEVRRRLLHFRRTFGSIRATARQPLPLLSRIRNVRAARPLVAGIGDPGSADTQLHDNSKDFVRFGVVPGSVVFDRSDGSYARVKSVARHALDVGGWVGGARNRLTPGDAYEIVGIPALDGTVATTLGADRDATGLTDTKFVDFSKIGVQQGDAIEKPDAADSAIVTKVREGRLDTQGPGPGRQGFVPGDRYRLRTNGGIATGLPGGRLRDNRPGRIFDGGNVTLVQSLTTGAFAFAGVLNANTLRLATPPTLNLFGPSEPYLVSAFLDLPQQSASDGWLPVHRSGEPFPSGLTARWRNSGLSVPVTPSPNALSRIWTRFGEGSVRDFQFSGNERLSACTWYAANVAQCGFWLQEYLSGIASNGSATGLQDTSSAFGFSGAEPGDLLLLPKRSDRPWGIIRAVSGDTLSVYSMQGSSGTVTIRPGDAYRIKVAGYAATGIAQPGSAGLELRYSNPQFDASTDVNDAYAVVFDLTGTRFVGAGAVQERSAGGHALRLGNLQGGTRNTLKAGDRYSIRWGFIEHRFVDLSVQGEVSPDLQNERRVRNLAAQGPVSQSAPLFSVHDYDAAGRSLGVGYLSASPGSAQLDVAVSGIQMHLGTLDGIADADSSRQLQDNDRNFRRWGVRPGDWVEDLSDRPPRANIRRFGRVRAVLDDTRLDLEGLSMRKDSAYRIYIDLPPWFLANGWDRLVYVAEADSLRPAGTRPGSLPCLRFSAGVHAGSCAQALVVATGAALREAGGLIQNRSLSSLDNFLEGENGSAGDGRFAGSHFDPASNDQIRIVE